MASSLFGNSTPIPRQNNLLNMVQQFNQFKAQMSGKDPQAIVKNMLESGQMSQQQFNQIAQMANQLQQFLK